MTPLANKLRPAAADAWPISSYRYHRAPVFLQVQLIIDGSVDLRTLLRYTAIFSIFPASWLIFLSSQDLRHKKTAADR